jgi:rRNA processing
VKRHVLYKQKMRLLGEYEGGKGRVIVAPELGVRGGGESDGEDASASGGAAGKRRRGGAKEGTDEADVATTWTKEAKKTKVTGERSEDGAVGDGRRATDDHGDGDDVDVVDKDDGDVDRSSSSSESSDAGALPGKKKVVGGKGGEWSGVARTGYRPFQKELAIAAARRGEIAAREARFAAEEKAHAAARQKSARERRDKAASFRKVTMRGQPVMKHRMNALLEKIERDSGGGGGGGGVGDGSSSSARARR